MVSPGILIKPLEGSKNTSREDEAESSKMEAKAGGSNGLPFAIYIALIAYLDNRYVRHVNIDNIKNKTYRSSIIYSP